MQLSNRLMAIANRVKPDSIIADVGTDHGYIPVYLAKKGLIKKGYAMDISQGSLEKAVANIKAYRVEDTVIPLLSDGLKELNDWTVNTLIIAGMGGMLIRNILMDSMSKLENINTMILSPHLDTPVVRKTIHSLGFCIDNEDIIYEDQKYYPIIECKKGNESYDREEDYIYGKFLIEKKHPMLKAYLEDKKATLNELISRVANYKTDTSISRLNELKNELTEVEEVMKCL